MFDLWIEESRDRLSDYGWRRAWWGARRRSVKTVLRREKIDATLIDPYALLVDQGRVVWAAIAQANGIAFSKGDMDAPANVVYGSDDYFDRCPHHLERIATSVFKLKHTVADDPTLRNVAAVISDEQNFVAHLRLPFALTDGHTAFLSSLLLHRSWLPDSILASRLLPIVVAPAETDVCMLLPLSCWAESLQQDVGRIQQSMERGEKLKRRHVSQQQLDADREVAERNPYRRVRAGELVPGASSNTVAMTKPCAVFLRETARTNRLGSKWHLRIGGSKYARTMDISTGTIPPDHSVTVSEGLDIAYPKSEAHSLRGMVIDYRQTPVEGFVLVDP